MWNGQPLQLSQVLPCRVPTWKKNTVSQSNEERYNMWYPRVCEARRKKSRKEQIKVRGTVKATILMGDDRVPCLVPSSMYDTKPVCRVRCNFLWFERMPNDKLARPQKNVSNKTPFKNKVEICSYLLLSSGEKDPTWCSFFLTAMYLQQHRNYTS